MSPLSPPILQNEDFRDAMRGVVFIVGHARAVVWIMQFVIQETNNKMGPIK